MVADNAQTIRYNINMAFLSNSLGIVDQEHFTFRWFPTNVAAKAPEHSVDFTTSSVLGKCESNASQPRDQDPKRGKPQDGRREDTHAGRAPARVSDEHFADWELLLET